MDIGRADFGSGAWTPDDTIVFTPNYSSGLWRMAASGGGPAETSPSPTRRTASSGTSGRRFCRTARPCSLPASGRRSNSHASRSTRSKPARARWSWMAAFTVATLPAATFCLAVRQRCFAAPFDVNRQEVTRPPAPVSPTWRWTTLSGLAQFSVSLDGHAGLCVSECGESATAARLDGSNGPCLPIGEERRVFSDPRLSPDGRRVAVSIRDERDADIWVYDLVRGTFGRVTSSPATQSDPVWTPDGRRLFFLFEEPVFHIYSRLADGGPAPERTPRRTSPTWPHRPCPRMAASSCPTATTPRRGGASGCYL